MRSGKECIGPFLEDLTTSCGLWEANPQSHLIPLPQPERWQHLRAKLREAGVPVHEEGGTSLYLQGPDGERIELIADPLGEMYGSPVV